MGKTARGLAGAGKGKETAPGRLDANNTEKRRIKVQKAADRWKSRRRTERFQQGEKGNLEKGTTER